MTPAALLGFWREAGPRRWFRKDAAFDATFRARFMAAYEAARNGELDGWAADPEGALALVILLDQFPRNCFRDTPGAFATDAKARDVARAALDAGFDQRVELELRNFFYLPFMHSEDLADQERAVELTRALGADAQRHAFEHREIIRRFGRFPHRNAILGRATQPEEQRFLDAGGFAG